MSNTVPASLETLPHAYRAATVQYYCSVCQRPATYACPSCKRVFCLEHTTFIDRCPDCDLRLSQVEHRGIRIALTAGALLAGGLVLSGMFLGMASLFGWMFGCSLVGALWMRRQRRLLDGRGTGPLLLRGATIAIAPDAPDTDPRLRRSVGYGSGHSAGALPQVPMWQRTYWR